MVEFERRITIFGVPKEVLFYSIELIGESLIEDARRNYGNRANFSTSLDVIKRARDKPWEVIYSISFDVFDYQFYWRIVPEGKGHQVIFVASTPGRWWEFLFEMDKKLEYLFETQWSAFYHFTLGFVTAVSYLAMEEREARKRAREHVRGAKEKVVERGSRKVKKVKRKARKTRKK